MKFIIPFIFAALLSACAGKPLEKSTTASQLAAKAVVILSVTSSEEAGRRTKAIFHMDQKGVDPAAHLSATRDVLGIPKASDFPDLYGTVYVLDVTPGAHSIDSWQVGDAGYWIRPATPPVPLKFEVQAGEILYLGNLHMEVALGKGFFGNSFAAGGVPMVKDRRAIDIPLAEEKNPAIKGLIKPNLLPLGQWAVQATRSQIEMMPPPLPLRR